MDPTLTIEAVIDVVKDAQKKGGRECPRLLPTTCPADEVPGFNDSLIRVEATVELEQKLGCTFQAQSIFDKNGEALTIGQVATRIIEQNTKKAS